MLEFLRLKSFKPTISLLSKAIRFSLSLLLLTNTTLVYASIDMTLKHANTLYTQKKFEAAREEYEYATELDKGSLSAWRGLGWSYWSLGEKKRAYDIWNDLIKSVPSDQSTILTLGKANEQDQHWKKAFHYYSHEFKLNSHKIASHQGKARIYINQKKFQKAEQESRAALSKKKSDDYSKSLLADSLMGQGRYKEAEFFLMALTKNKPVKHNLHRLSKALAKQGKYEEAAKHYKTSLDIKSDKDTISAWRGLGASLRKKGQKKHAYGIWQNILTDYPDDVQTLLAIGRATHQDKLLEKSLSYYAHVIKKAPDIDAAYLGRAKIFFSQLDFESAEKEVELILKKSPSNKEAKLVLIDILIATNRSKQAEKILRPLVEKKPNPKYQARLAKILSGFNKNEEAARYFKKSLREDPNNSKTVQGLARVLWNQHQFDESTELLQNYLKKYPENDFVRVRLAEHATASSKWELAEQQFKILIDKHPLETRWKIKHAQQLDMAGKHKEAVKLAKQIVAVEPNEGALKLLANDAIFPGDYVSGIHWIKEIMKVKSTPDLFNQLGMLYLKMGEHFAENDKYEEAMIQYAAATKEFQHAADLDPIKTSALISKVKVLRLQKKYPEALKLANQLYDKYPSSVDVIQQLVNIYKDQGEYATARKWLEVKHPFFQGNTELQKNIAKFTFYSGEQKEGLQMMEKLRDASSSQSVQVLLFHGITASKRQSTVPVHLFRDQMLALKEAGYHSISVAQLLSFLDGKEELPDKPILITFDDARRDSIQYADPVLEEAGFQATMFVPVADISTHGVFTVVWPTLRTISKTGRWEMQCHSTEGQHFLPVDKNGYQGHFMANKKWLKNADRQETTEEFTTRITQDLKFCKEAMENKIPGSDVFAFAFPFSDQGHRSLSNEPEAFTLNHDIVKNQFQLAFHVNNDYPVTKNSPRFSLPRFEVPRTLTGKDLVKQLKTIEPAISVPYALARLKMDAGQYDQAIKILDKLERDGGIDKAELLAKKGRILRWSGDYTGARKQLEKARALQPNNPIVLTDIAVLDSRLKDVVKIDGQYIEDNANRSYYSFGSTVEIPISDGLSLAAYYKYLNFDQQFTTGLLTEEHHFRAHGHQFEGKVNYEISAKSLLSISAGMADFSGDSSPILSKSGETFPVGSIKLQTEVGRQLGLFFSANHTYVNTAGAILNGLAYSRARAGFKLKLLDSLFLKANYAYSYYTDDNQRNKVVVELGRGVWKNPDITIGTQFIYDDIQNENDLFWTPNKYISFAVPLNLKKEWGAAFVTEFNVAPGVGKEDGNGFKFQVNTTGTLTWNYKDDVNLYLSAGRYEASSYSNFSVFAGGSLRF